MRVSHVATRSGGRDSESDRDILRGEAPCFTTTLNTARVRTGMSALYQGADLLSFPLRARMFGGHRQSLRVSRPFA